ncbi:MAG: hypothetical protein HYZ44_18185 [Bacteroidetes bacterium]|nr:hypothetical protein [Bacteroidota bacterium]
MKFFAILLFSFELLAPSLLSASSREATISDSSKRSFSVAQSNIYSFFFLEECNEEEREGKDALPLSIELYSFKNLSFASNTRSIHIAPDANQNLFDTHPPLYQLNQTFLI